MTYWNDVSVVSLRTQTKAWIIWYGRLLQKLFLVVYRPLQIATFLATAIFNKGFSTILSIINGLKVTIGPTALELCNNLDAERIKIADKRTLDTSKEGRIARRSQKSAAEEAVRQAEGPMYEAGMAD